MTSLQVVPESRYDLQEQRIKELEAELAELREAAMEVVEAERLNRSSTRNYRGLFETKKRPRHQRFENAIDKLAALLPEEGK